MCRLAAYAGDPAPLAPLVFGGEHPLHDQSFRPRELLHGTINADGYGVVWYPAGELASPARIARSVPIWHDPDLQGVLAATQAPVALASLRNTTPGIPIGDQGLGPLVRGSLSFALNGFVEEFRPRFLRSFIHRLPDALVGELRGTSDTELIFLRVVAEVEAGARLDEACARVVREVLHEASREGASAYLNILASDGTRVVATRTATGERSNSLYLVEGWSDLPGGTTLASEPFDDAVAWTRVPHGSLVRLTPEGPPRIDPL